ncbi:hypothetical protein BDN71DRAFT_1547810 [Pleurotus eryngii]|uniref:Uncharacterized protein n=1 Tax=Pleurotus eryngii TaxID=5323 RepID=A0A9P5ZZM7_PLEER|nr:hypothetical protein BDN71DRAFT_1547810 [Pleurotus eryngii]
MGTKVKIEQSNPMCPPMMGDGNVDATVLWDWFNKAKNFFHLKSIASENKAISVAYGMSGVHTIYWLSANSLALESMMWDKYKTCMHSLFLASNWEHLTHMDVLHIQQNSKSFVKFSLEMMGKNNLLARTDSFLNDELLRDTLEVNMDRELAQECNCENLVLIISLCDWLDKVKHLDESKYQCLEEITCSHINFCPTTATCLPVPGAAASSALSSTFVPIPKLLQTKLGVLNAGSSGLVI